MPDQTPEEAMRQACDLLIAGDLFTAMGLLTLEAQNEVMAHAATFMGMPLPYSYVIDSQELLGADHRFNLRFDGPQGEVRASVTWREVDGAWRISELHIEGFL